MRVCKYVIILSRANRILRSFNFLSFSFLLLFSDRGGFVNFTPIFLDNVLNGGLQTGKLTTHVHGDFRNVECPAEFGLLQGV